MPQGAGSADARLDDEIGVLRNLIHEAAAHIDTNLTPRDFALLLNSVSNACTRLAQLIRTRTQMASAGGSPDVYVEIEKALERIQLERQNREDRGRDGSPQKEGGLPRRTFKKAEPPASASGGPGG